MLLPTQQSAGLAATNLMQSAIDSAEKRRVEEEERTKGKQEDPVLKARMSMDTAQARAKEKIDSYLFDAGHVSTNELKMQLIDKLGMALGLKKLDEESGFSYGKKLETILSTMEYAQKRALEKEIGLDDLDISIDVLVAAIKNPYANDNERLEFALEKHTGGGKESQAAQSKVLQRLESIANPKSIEELKLEPSLNDPTRVEDDEVRQERAADIRGKEAMEKLDDVKELQEAVKENNADAAEAGAKGETEPGSAVAESLDMIQVLVGAADAGKAADAQSEADGQTEIVEGDASDPQTDARSNQIEAGLEPATEPEMEPGDRPDLPILTVHVDDIGIYDLLRQKKAA